MTFEQIMQEWQDWSVKAFSSATAHSSLNKAKSEIREIQECISRNEPFEDVAIEYADGIMCLLHSAAKYGIDAKGIIKAFETKFGINQTRQWSYNDDGTYSHIKKKK